MEQSMIMRLLAWVTLCAAAASAQAQTPTAGHRASCRQQAAGTSSARFQSPGATSTCSIPRPEGCGCRHVSHPARKTRNNARRQDSCRSVSRTARVTWPGLRHQLRLPDSSSGDPRIGFLAPASATWRAPAGFISPQGNQRYRRSRQ